jgi:hypothetical protein
MQLTHSPQGWPKGKPAPQLVSWWSTIIQWVCRILINQKKAKLMKIFFVLSFGIYF